MNIGRDLLSRYLGRSRSLDLKPATTSGRYAHRGRKALAKCEQRILDAAIARAAKERPA